MQEKAKEPEIRFAGFTGAWEQRKIGELSQIITGGTPNTSNSSYWEPGEIPWLSSGEVNKKRIFYTDRKISRDGLTNSSAKWVTSRSVLIALAGQGKTRGTVAINEIPLTTNQSIAAISFSQQVDVDFIYQNLEKRYEEIRTLSSGDGSRGGLNKNIIANITIPYTSLEEQKKIGAFLSSIDSIITLHQRKYEKLLNIKKSMLEKMFPKEGEVVPEIRFKGFTGAWEQRKLGAIVQITMGQSPDGSTYSDTPADYILVQGNADLKNGWVCPRVWTTQKTKFATAGDLIMSVRAPAGSVGKTAYDVVLGRGVASLKGNEFIYQSLVKMDFDGYWKAESTGSTFESLSSDSISTAELYCPSEDEQHKIGIFLSRLDSLLTLHQRQSENTERRSDFCVRQGHSGALRRGRSDRRRAWRRSSWLERCHGLRRERPYRGPRGEPVITATI